MTTVLVPEQLPHSEMPVQPSTGRPAQRRVVVIAGAAVIAVGVLLASFLMYLLLISGEQEHRSQSTLYAQFRSELAHGIAPIGGPIALGRPVTLLEIPSLHLRDVVVEGSASRALMRGPGHEPGTPLPGQPGTSVLLGRRTAFGGPFADLNRLNIGDDIQVTTGQGRYTFRVDATWRSDQVHAAPKSVASRLTLVTGDPALSPHRSLVVSAAVVGAPATAAALTTPERSATPLSTDTGAALPAYLWAQALLALVLLLLWLWRRVPRLVLWVGAVPVSVAVLWNLFENLAALLPNTL